VLDLPDLGSCRDNMHLVRLAISEWLNHHGPAVYGQNAAGDWKHIHRAKLDRSAPYRRV
jgi:hypothetical protein